MMRHGTPNHRVLVLKRASGPGSAYHRNPCLLGCGIPTGLPWHLSSSRPVWTSKSGRNILLFLQPSATLSQLCFHPSFLPFSIITNISEEEWFVSASPPSASLAIGVVVLKQSRLLGLLAVREHLLQDAFQTEKQPGAPHGKQPQPHLQTNFRVRESGDFIGLASGSFREGPSPRNCTLLLPSPAELMPETLPFVPFILRNGKCSGINT